MDWKIAILTVACQMIVAVYVYGRLVERVSGHADDIKTLRERSHKQGGRIDILGNTSHDHERRISGIENKYWKPRE